MAKNLLGNTILPQMRLCMGRPYKMTLIVFDYCLSNEIHCMGQNRPIKSLTAYVCVSFCLCVRAHGFWRPKIWKTVRDGGSVPMVYQYQIA